MVTHSVAGHLKRDRDDEPGHNAERQVDEEDPTPAEMVDEEPTQQRAEHRRDREYARRDPRVAASVARRHDVGDHCLRQARDTAPTDTLQRASEDEHREVGGETGEHGRGHEQHDGALDRALTPVDITELAEQRHERDEGELIRDEQPRQLAELADVVGDGLARGRHDQQIERRQHQGQHQPRDDEPSGASRDGAVVFRRFGACRLHRGARLALRRP